MLHGGAIGGGNHSHVTFVGIRRPHGYLTAVEQLARCTNIAIGLRFQAIDVEAFRIGSHETEVAPRSTGGEGKRRIGRQIGCKVLRLSVLERNAHKMADFIALFVVQIIDVATISGQRAK